MKPTEQLNWDTATAVLLTILKPGQEITGVQLPVNQKDHIVQFLTVAPEGHEKAGKIVDITDHAAVLLNSGKGSKGYWKGGAQLSKIRHGSVDSAIRHAILMLGHFLYGTSEIADFHTQSI